MKDRYDPRSNHNIISGKASIVSISEAGVSGRCTEPLRMGFRGWSPLRKLLGSKENLDWLKIDLNTAKIIIVQDYEGAKN